MTRNRLAAAVILAAAVLFALARSVGDNGPEYRAVERDRSAESSGGPSSGTIPPAASSPVTSLLPSAPTGELLDPGGSPAPPSPTGKRPAATVEPRTAPTLRGIASWFRSPAGVSAAGPALRKALGPNWRGTVVTVCAGRCVETVLDDWCACPKRLIDLDAPVFAKLAPLSRGLLRVEVTG